MAFVIPSQKVFETLSPGRHACRQWHKCSQCRRKGQRPARKWQGKTSGNGCAPDEGLIMLLARTIFIQIIESHGSLRTLYRVQLALVECPIAEYTGMKHEIFPNQPAVVC